jgi:hypothetical protein
MDSRTNGELQFKNWALSLSLLMHIDSVKGLHISCKYVRFQGKWMYVYSLFNIVSAL